MHSIIKSTGLSLNGIIFLNIVDTLNPCKDVEKISCQAELIARPGKCSNNYEVINEINLSSKCFEIIKFEFQILTQYILCCVNNSEWPISSGKMIESDVDSVGSSSESQCESRVALLANLFSCCWAVDPDIDTGTNLGKLQLKEREERISKFNNNKLLNLEMH